MATRDPISVLTLAELDAGSRLLKADFVYHLTSPGAPRKWEAVAIAAWLLERRDDPGANVARYRSMTSEEVEGVLASYAGDVGSSPAEVLEAARQSLADRVDAGEDTVQLVEVLDLLTGSPEAGAGLVAGAEVDTTGSAVDTTDAGTDTTGAAVDTPPAAPEVQNPTATPPESLSPGRGDARRPTSPASRSASTER